MSTELFSDAARHWGSPSPRALAPRPGGTYRVCTLEGEEPPPAPVLVHPVWLPGAQCAAADVRLGSLHGVPQLGAADLPHGALWASEGGASPDGASSDDLLLTLDSLPEIFPSDLASPSELEDLLGLLAAEETPLP